MQSTTVQRLLFAFVVLLLAILACDGGFETLPTGATVTVPSTIEGLIRALSDPSYAVRFRAAKALGDIGPRAVPAVPALAEALSDSRYEMRLFAAEALSKIGPKAKQALPEVITALESDDRDQETAFLVVTLGNIGPDAEPAVPLLIEILQHGNDNFTRSLAAEALGKIGNLNGLFALLQILESEESPIFDVRQTAIQGVANFGERARFAVPVLAELLYDENRHTAALAACAIAKITGLTFPDSKSDCGVYEIAENGDAYITTAARKWWEQQGQLQDWHNQ